MALEDRIRTSAQSALAELTARLDQDVRDLVEKLVAAAIRDRDDAIAAQRHDLHEQATADAQRQIESAGARVRATMDEAVRDARSDERAKAASEMQRLVDAEMAALTRLLESMRGLDSATSLSNVLDVLGQSCGREAARAAVLVVRNERLMGWKLSGFGVHDSQPKSIEMSLNDSGIVGTAVATAQPATSGGGEAAGPAFAALPRDRTGLAVPVIVGGRAVAVVYADSVTVDGQAHPVPSGWPEMIEMLARHASRCLEALTIQKTARPQSPRFWVPGAVRPSAAPDGAVAAPIAETTSPGGPTGRRPSGVLT
jgi:hypothetical protein